MVNSLERRKKMKILDQMLRKIGLMRISQMPYDDLEVEWRQHEPVRVDIRLKNGQRVAGRVDPWWPNKSPIGHMLKPADL
jgi:hypothetical protein